MKKNLFKYALLLQIFCSCSAKQQTKLTKVVLTNEKGFVETITQKERLKEFQSEETLKNQPHKKIVRVFNQGGENKTVITTYHPNGQIFQLLESVNNKAFGCYKEWFSNGVLKVQANVIKGIADINLSGQNSWVFDGASCAFSENGKLIALFNYSEGKLEKESYTYYPTGQLREVMPYKSSKLNGVYRFLDENGNCLEETNYEKGKKIDFAKKFWEPNKIFSEEFFENGLLKQGSYYSSKGELLSKVINFSGHKTSFFPGGGYEMREYQEGIAHGEVKVFSSLGILENIYHEKNGAKSGLEILYYPKSEKPKLSIDWVGGKLHGSVKTWYPNGALESQKEMSLNKKQGVSTAWYSSGDLMFIEEYDNNKLVKGKYFEKEKSTPISTVSHGQGLVTIFDEKGILTKKIEYYAGQPVE